MTQSSFYADGEVLDAAVVESNDVPGSIVPSQAPSGFYPDGTAYTELQQADSVLAEVQAALDAALVAQAAAEAAQAASEAEAAAAHQAYLDALALLSTALLKANNLSDLTNTATARANLGLGNVDNTSDANKPVSTAQQTALNLNAPLASPALTGTPTAPTATAGTNTTQLATTAFVEAARVILAAADALKAPLASPALTGTPTAPTATPGTNTTQLATTAFVEAARVILAAADALKAPLASPALTGTPTAPTAAPGTNTTQLATTAFVEAARVILAAATALKANIASPTFTGTPAAPTAAGGTNTTQIATTAFVEAVRVALVAVDATKAPLASPALTGTPTAPTAAANNNSTQLATTAYVDLAVAVGGGGGGGGHGQCRLALSGGNLVLKPFNGNKLVVNGATCTVPDAGVTLAPTSSTPGTTYYIYATASGGIVNALEYSTTAHAPSTTSGNKGNEIKSGDDTRTLVGMARPITGPAWQDTAAQRFVRSWFNDAGLALLGATTTASTTSATLVEVAAAARAEFLSWLGDALDFSVVGTMTDATSVNSQGAAVGVDGAALGVESTANNYVASARCPIAPRGTSRGYSEGYHYATPMLRSIGGGTATFNSGTGTVVTGTVKR